MASICEAVLVIDEFVKRLRLEIRLLQLIVDLEIMDKHGVAIDPETKLQEYSSKLLY
jgi:hypothetical protein